MVCQVIFRRLDFGKIKLCHQKSIRNSGSTHLTLHDLFCRWDEVVKNESLFKYNDENLHLQKRLKLEYMELRWITVVQILQMNTLT